MKTAFAIGIMIFVVFAACTVSGQVRADKMDKAFKKEEDSKTWVVYDAEGGHMSVGDKFRIKFKNSKREFKPLFKLRIKWGHKETDPPIVLTHKTNTWLCGMTQVKTIDHEQNVFGHGPWHMFVIEIPYENEEIMRIKWSPDKFDSELSDEALETKCESTVGQNHGGRAHAEPN